MATAPTKKVNWGSKLVTKVEARPHSYVICGQPNIGKTGFVAHWKNNLFVNLADEDGISQLKAMGSVPDDVHQVPENIRDYDDLASLIDWLTTEDHGFKYVTFDVLSGLQQLCLRKHADTSPKYKGKVGSDFLDFGKKGFVEAFELFWRPFIQSIDKMRDAKRVSPVFLSHCVRETMRDPDGANYDRWNLDAMPLIQEQLLQWADNIMFMHQQVTTTSTDINKTGKATGGIRWMNYTMKPTYPGKNRLGLSDIGMPMGNSAAECYENWKATVAEAKEMSKKENV